MPLETVVWAYQLNLFSIFRLCQLCAPHLETAGGGGLQELD